MADEADEAQIRAELLIELSLRRRKAESERKGQACCEVCGDTIPARRRACLPDVSTCVDCQYKREQVRRHWRQ